MSVTETFICDLLPVLSLPLPTELSGFNIGSNFWIDLNRVNIFYYTVNNIIFWFHCFRNVDFLSFKIEI